MKIVVKKGEGVDNALHRLHVFMDSFNLNHQILRNDMELQISFEDESGTPHDINNCTYCLTEKDCVLLSDSLSNQSETELLSVFVDEICAEFRLFGTVVYDDYPSIQGSQRGNLYIVMGTNPDIGKGSLPEKPSAIYRRINRCTDLFHPYIWAYNFTENPNIYKACYELVEYAKRTEFIVSLYLENGIQAPDVMRYSEISSLEDFHSKLFDELTDPELFMQLSKSIEKYLRYDKSKKKIVREYLSYFRSQKFLDSKNAFQQIIGFLKHKKNIVPLKLLLKTTGNVAKFEMQEHEYKVFAEKIKYMAPDVIYSIDKVEKFDHGLYNTKDGSPSPFGKRVTMEEYDRIRRERFASESWDVLKDLVPAYFELRTVYYNKIDEPLIAKVYNSFKFEYARCDSLMELKERGEIGLKIIPASDFMNFVSFAKANKLKFYIDYMGDYAPCSLNEIPVIYNLYNEEKILSIIDHLMDATIYESHM